VALSFWAFPEVCLSTGVGARASLPVHNIRTGLSYSSITAAINANETLGGDTVFVDEGVYSEHVYVGKSLNIVGANQSTTVVDSMGSFRGFLVFADRVNITGFTVQNAAFAIYLNSSRNRVYGNNVRNSKIGVRLDNGENNTVVRNVIENSLLDGEGIFLENAKRNVIQGNLFANDSFAISFVLSTENTIKENTIKDCPNASIWLQSSSNNKIYHNNFANNTGKAIADFSFNTVWNDKYPSGGNYWNSYNHPDLNNGANQNVSGSDGIGDIPHVIDENNRDNYPLMGPINVFDAGSYDGFQYNVDVVSNSTVSVFRFNATEGPLLRFRVAGQNETAGFGRVTIPKRLLWVDDRWNVTMDKEPVSYTRNADENHTYLYFTYQHSAKIVEIRGTYVIPELKSPAILLSALVLTALAVAVARALYSDK
jgi:parallel beta-helix repeat protein